MNPARQEKASRKKKGSVLTIDASADLHQELAMARQLRIQYEGAIYHLMNRGGSARRNFS
jgi:hypothetical protein